MKKYLLDLKIVFLLFFVLCVKLVNAWAGVGIFSDRTETVDGVTWKFSVHTNNEVIIGVNIYGENGWTQSTRAGVNENTLPPDGKIIIPSTLGGYPVFAIGGACFSECKGIKNVVIPEGVILVGGGAFENCTGLEEIVFPSTLRTISYISNSSSSTYKNNAFAGCTNIKKIIFNGPPIDSYGFTCLMNQCYNARIYYTREYGAQWQKVFAQTRFLGFTPPSTNSVEIVSTAIRDSDPSILDVVYKVKSDKSRVKVRAVGYLDGIRSFSNIVRVENLVDGTEANLGDAITANEEHTLSWKASEDLNVDLAKIKVEVLAVENELLPMEMIRIPAVGGQRAMEFSWNVHTQDQVFDALLWLYADKTPGLVLANGVLSGDGKPLLTGTEFYTTEIKQDPYMPEYTYEEWIYHADDAIGFVFKQMGLNLLKGAELEYVNRMTRKGLEAPDPYYGEKSYAYRWIEE